jgi:pimeloyl-ACP methyl ester carboxylesterase
VRQSARIFTTSTGRLGSSQDFPILRRLVVTASREGEAVLQLPQEAPAPQTRLVELPGRGVTRVWECAGPPDAPVLMLLHGVTVTAELNWGKVLVPLARHFRVIAMDLRGHGDGIPVGWRFRLEDCADDVAALAKVLGIASFVAVGYSMGGMVAQLVWRRHGAMVSGLVLCATARNVLGSPAEKLAALTWPAAAAAIRWNPLLPPVSAEILGRTPLGTALSAVQAVNDFSSHTWISQVDVPAAVVVTTRDYLLPLSRQRKLAAAIPGASVHEVAADHAVCITAPQVFAQVLLQACWSVTAGPQRAGVGVIYRSPSGRPYSA